MTDISTRVNILPDEVKALIQSVYGTGKVGGGAPTATGGVITFPSGYLISCPGRGQGRSDLIELTTGVDVSASNGDEVYLTHRSASFELAAAVSTPVGSLKLGNASGIPVDTFTQDAATGGRVAGIESYALLERRGDDQTVNINAGDHLEFNNFAAASGVSVSSGGAQDQASGLIELESAGDWLLICWIDAIFSGPTGQVNLVWRNNTAAALLSRSEAIIRPPTSAVNAATNQICATILSVATPVQIEVRITSETLLTQLSESDSGGPRALILKLA